MPQGEKWTEQIDRLWGSDPQDRTEILLGGLWQEARITNDLLRKFLDSQSPPRQDLKEAKQQTFPQVRSGKHGRTNTR